MKTKNKVVLLALCMVALIAVSVLGTMAYLTSTDTVTNTFTVGNVSIKLDEKKVNTDGTVDNSATGRVKENSYKLLPGHTYTKDPMVTVLKGSESSYIKMTVTFSKADELDTIFGGADLTKIFNNYDKDTWTYKGNTEDTVNKTRTYEFWYKEPVAASDADVPLKPLFESFTVPGSITNTQLAKLEGMKITVNAYAIQADGFTTPELAWAAYNG